MKILYAGTMKGFSEKILLQLAVPSEEDAISDQQRILLALAERGYEKVTFPLRLLKKLHKICRESSYSLTVTLVYQEDHYLITNLEAGDQTSSHYGLAVDYGSTTILMQLIDMTSCKILATVKKSNAQILYGTDIGHCYLSGAFTAHSNLESAITVGIFPDLPREKYTCIPNASLDGARRLLLDRSLLSDIQYFTANMFCVQFASIPDFLIRMQAAKFIPHTDMERFPIIKNRL